MNQLAFRESDRNLPLNDSMKELSVGLPGREKSSVTPRMKAHRSSSLLTNFGPLSRRIVFGRKPEQQRHESAARQHHGRRAKDAGGPRGDAGPTLGKSDADSFEFPAQPMAGAGKPKRGKKMKIGKAALVAVETGSTDEPKSEFFDKLMKRAEKSRADDESVERSLNRLIESDEKSRALFKAMSLAPGRDTPAPVAPVVKAAPSLGPAHDELSRLAATLRKAEPGLSEAGAFAKIFGAPENSELRAAPMQEERSRW